ncbi:inorganic phosphate transporter [Sinimarinibacterium sp. CAU 1509]|uniref:inorganic phosphate transporter n=1 Tax=Sinimarinibacterium sp. CAU 1509 TaxID=2562283 RepID=UPI0010AC31C6|nr:inorganic phosphate transporter [Sinimarinibacterium sp. CAU 1509]TJY55935.1 inorganic phosphate transporter [Sinimarinibacterium sp. CAU 1509]
MAVAIALLCVFMLAYANGANDNFKGVATLFGSGVSDYRKALNWATGMTLLGSLVAVLASTQLLATFSGKQFVSAQTLQMVGYPLAVCAACAATVLLATRFGLPISTTHALAGGLLGAAFAAPDSVIDWARAGRSIFLPLAVGPVLAVVAAVVLYPALRALRTAMGVSSQTCVCVGDVWVPQVDGTATSQLRVSVADQAECRQQYAGHVMGMPAQRLIDGLHYLSAGVVSFARGLNDTPKIVAVTLLVAPFMPLNAAFPVIGVVIAAGGLLGARRVAATMSQKITAMNPGQGLSANLVTSALVLAASPLGLPLSTTHVSCGALFGIGAVTGQARWRTISGIVMAWIITLPMAALLGMLFMRLSLNFS